MVTPWLVLVVIGVVVIAGVVGFMKGSSAKKSDDATPVANSGFVRTLPRYETRMRWMFILLIAATAVLLVSTVVTSMVSARPVDRDYRHDELANRDIVLCLDVSGSMVDFDAEIVDRFAEMVDGFDGERVGLNIWNATTRVVFPLTDDYDVVESELEHAADIFSGVSGWGTTGPSYQDYYDYTAGTVPPVGTGGSSLSGDGLASCVMAFDLEDDERARTVILATDNEVWGSGIYTLPEAMTLAEERDVIVHGLFASYGYSANSQDRAEYENEIDRIGGSFFDYQDPDAAADIIDQIQAMDAAELGGDPEVVETDTPDQYIPWLIGASAIFLVIVWRLRL